MKLGRKKATAEVRIQKGKGIRDSL